MSNSLRIRKRSLEGNQRDRTIKRQTLEQPMFELITGPQFYAHTKQLRKLFEEQTQVRVWVNRSSTQLVFTAEKKSAIQIPFPILTRIPLTGLIEAPSRHYFLVSPLLTAETLFQYWSNAKLPITALHLSFKRVSHPTLWKTLTS
jgi:hypothetical protein